MNSQDQLECEIWSTNWMNRESKTDRVPSPSPQRHAEGVSFLNIATLFAPDEPSRLRIDLDPSLMPVCTAERPSASPPRSPSASSIYVESSGRNSANSALGAYPPDLPESLTLPPSSMAPRRSVTLPSSTSASPLSESLVVSSESSSPLSSTLPEVSAATQPPDSPRTPIREDAPYPCPPRARNIFRRHKELAMPQEDVAAWDRFFLNGPEVAAPYLEFAHACLHKVAHSFFSTPPKLVRSTRTGASWCDSWSTKDGMVDFDVLSFDVSTPVRTGQLQSQRPDIVLHGVSAFAPLGAIEKLFAQVTGHAPVSIARFKAEVRIWVSSGLTPLAIEALLGGGLWIGPHFALHGPSPLVRRFASELSAFQGLTAYPVSAVTGVPRGAIQRAPLPRTLDVVLNTTNTFPSGPSTPWQVLISGEFGCMRPVMPMTLKELFERYGLGVAAVSLPSAGGAILVYLYHEPPADHSLLQPESLLLSPQGIFVGTTPSQRCYLKSLNVARKKDSQRLLFGTYPFDFLKARLFQTVS